MNTGFQNMSLYFLKHLYFTELSVQGKGEKEMRQTKKKQKQLSLGLGKQKSGCTLALDQTQQQELSIFPERLMWIHFAAM